MAHKKVVILQLHPAAPPKPREGDPCNGCGVCCLAEPCPMGALLTLRTSGPCQWLQWNAQQKVYRCGVLAATDPEASGEPKPGVSQAGTLRWAPSWMQSWAHAWARAWRKRMHRAARRWIAAGTACDCSMDDVAPGS